MSYFRCIENEKMDTRSSIINPLAQKRDFQGQFKKTYGPLIHDIVDNNETLKEQLLDLKKKEEESNVRHTNELLFREIVKDSTSYICKACHSDLVTIPKQKNEETPEEISYEIESDEYNEELTRKCFETGDDLSKLISSDLNKLRYKNQIGI